MRILLGVGICAGLGLAWALFWLGFTHQRFLAYHRHTGRPVPPLGLRGGVVFYLRTLGSILQIVVWLVWALGRDGLRQPRGPVTGPPVLCVHGFHLSGTSLWGMRRTLERRGRPTRAVWLGLPYQHQEVYARPLRRVLEELRAQRPDEPIDVVAHSMGGLILRWVLARNPELAAGVRRIVTLGTPHRGTALLRWLRSGPVYRMMSRKSGFIRDLPTFEESAPHAEVLTVGTVHDLVVYPLETALLPEAEQVTYQRIGHLGLLTEPSVRERVADWLQR